MNVGTVSLGAVADVSAGQPAPKAHEFADEGHPFIRAGSLERLLNGGSEDSLEKISESTALRKRLKLYPENTVLFAKSGMSAKLGRVYRLKGPAYVVSHLAAVKPTGRYDPHYLTYWLRANPPSRLIKDDAYPSIRTSEIAEIEVPALEVNEQHRIAAILDKAEAIRLKHERALDLADAFLKSVFLEMFGYPLRPKDGLEVSNIGAECNLYAGNSLPKGEEFRGQEGGIILTKVSDMNSPENTTEIKSARLWAEDDGKIRQSIIAPSGTIVFPKRGGAISTNKKRVLARKAVLDPNLMGVFPKPTSRVSSEYLRAWFGFIDLVTISSGSAVPQLNKKDLAPLPIAVPSNDAMSMYSEVSKKNSTLRLRLGAALEEADIAFHALSQSAFRGEL
ncbi:MAG: restriction endonuclease subunit S [Antarcticimicrobium sp.]|uniref:restriction endonuclease subunit S n=1 Tax=Antarcticimicrobium sp. TaxID=2824147 RepID=UPI0026149C65|nr:restriction endonuclease subunit S [Antarcticimicrobium sp.]MDF1716938.1 restriction endonuclease subunit S [Antarcticimicrobium sp.]